MGRIMFLECEYGRFRELAYASCVAKQAAEYIARNTAHQVIEVPRPSPEEANNAIRRYKPHVVWFVGHGNRDAVTLERVQLWIRAPDHNTDILRDTIVCAESCLTGAYLGEYLVRSRGCRAYLGYKDPYWFLWCEGGGTNCPCSGDNPYGVRKEVWKILVESMHKATVTFVVSLAAGKDVYEANADSLKMFDKLIDEISRIRPENEAEASIIETCRWVLSMDKSAQVLYSSDHHSVPGGVRYAAAAAAVPLALAAASVGIMRKYGRK